MSEQRKHERKELVAGAALEFSSGKYEARISEIGPGGCYVDSLHDCNGSTLARLQESDAFLAFVQCVCSF